MNLIAHLRTFYGNLSEAEVLDIIEKTNMIYIPGHTGVKTNPNFEWVGTDQTDYSAACVTVKAKHELSVTGTDLQKKDTTDAILVWMEKAQNLTVSANRQQESHEAKLASTGFTMAEIGGHVGEMDKAEMKSLENSDESGVLIATIVPSKKFCHGTVVSIKDLDTGIVTEQISREKKFVRITGLIKKHEYEISVAYDGTNKTRKFSDSKKRIVS